MELLDHRMSATEPMHVWLRFMDAQILPAVDVEAFFMDQRKSMLRSTKTKARGGGSRRFLSVGGQRKPRRPILVAGLVIHQGQCASSRSRCNTCWLWISRNSRNVSLATVVEQRCSDSRSMRDRCSAIMISPRETCLSAISSSVSTRAPIPRRPPSPAPRFLRGLRQSPLGRAGGRPG